MAIDERTNSGSILSETPMSDEKPANQSSTGPRTQWRKQRAATMMPFRSPLNTAGVTFFIATAARTSETETEPCDDRLWLQEMRPTDGGQKTIQGDFIRQV